MSTTTDTRAGKTAVKIRRKDGVEQTYWKGAGRPKSAMRDERPKADETRSINPLDWSLPLSERISAKRQRAEMRSRAAAAREARAAQAQQREKQLNSKQLNSPVEELSDWHLWKGRDLCRELVKQLDQAVTDAPDVDEAHRRMEILAAIEKRKEELDLENERRNRERFRTRARRNLVLGLPTLSKLYYRLEGKDPAEARTAVTGSAPAASSPKIEKRQSRAGSSSAIFEKVGRFLTSWWDGLLDFFSRVSRS